MLIIPFDRPIDWRRPPVVTLALVIANVLVFLLFQLDDGRERQALKTQYYESGLAGIELPHYRDYLQAEGADEFLRLFGDDLERDTPWFERLFVDSTFQQRLIAGEVIQPGDPDYRAWRDQRESFDRRVTDTTVWGHGLRPSERAPSTFITYMFLHGGLMHLIGNMIFLIAVGLLVEIGIGSLVLAGLYVLSGLGAAGLFIGLNPASVVPLVGASGAIAGLMGLYGVLYGLRRVRFFYFIGVYFDYVRAPALLLLVLWLGNEVFQYLQYSAVSNVAYTAHIGGILTGAISGAIVRFGTNAVDEEALNEREETEALRQRMAEAQARLDAMEPERARPLFERLARDYPGNIEVLEGLFRATRFAPASEAYHETVHRILRLEPTDEATSDLILSAYRDYRDRARPRPRLNATAVDRMIELLLRQGTPAEVVPLIRTGLKHPERFASIADQACRLGSRLQREGQRDAARKLYRAVVQRFPASDAARTAEQALRKVSP